ncbi:MAG: hypothetical protein WBG32_03525 [Nodosilinea sp.]
MANNKWTRAGEFDGEYWEAKIPNHGRFLLMRPEGDYGNSDNPHARIDLVNGKPDFLTYHENFNGYFGPRELISTVISAVMGS